METLGRPARPAAPVRSTRPFQSRSAVLGSAIAHLLLLGALLYHGIAWVAPLSHPGDEHGHNIVLTYLPGRASAQSNIPARRTPPAAAKSQLTVPKPEKIEPKQDEAASPNTNAPVSDHPDSASGADALGEGDISIALAKYFPTPKPDLSSMPRGARGDVIVDVTIDPTGKVADLKLVSGIAPKIDEAVIATIRQWTFRPANRNGQPIASEQELLFHYENG